MNETTTGRRAKRRTRYGSIQVKLVEPKLSKASRDKAIELFKTIRTVRKAAAELFKVNEKPGLKVKELRRNAKGYLDLESSVLYSRIDRFKEWVDKYSIPNPINVTGLYPHEWRVQVEGEEKGPRFRPGNGTPHNYRKDGAKQLRSCVRERRAIRREITNATPGAGSLDYLENIITHRREGWFLGEQERVIFSKNKLPTEQSEYVGIEVECFLPQLRENTLRSLLKPYARQLSIVGDGSIHPDNPAKNIGREVRILMKQEDLHERLPLIMAAIREAGAQANDSCGLHVHFDMRSAPDALLHKRYTRLFYAQEWLGRLVKPYRRWSSYCKLNRSKNFLDERDRGDRYTRINTQAYHKYKTLEVRLHHGTVDTGDILNWISLIKAIMAKEELTEAPKRYEGFCQWAGLSGELREYVKAKIGLYGATDEITFLRDRVAAASEEDHETLRNQLYADAQATARCRATHTCPDSIYGLNNLALVRHGLESEELTSGLERNRHPIIGAGEPSGSDAIAVAIANAVDPSESGLDEEENRCGDCGELDADCSYCSDCESHACRLCPNEEGCGNDIHNCECCGDCDSYSCQCEAESEATIPPVSQAV